MGERPKRYFTAAMGTAVAVMVMIMLVGFKAAPNDGEIIAELFFQRAMILQDAYYGKISEDEAEYRLSEIEAGDLLQDDLYSILSNTDGEIDIIHNIFLIKYRQTGKSEHQKQYKIEVLWDMQGMSNNYYQECKYLISVVSTEGKEKLTSIDIDADIDIEL